MKEYIDFSDNGELWKGVADMGRLGQGILEEGLSAPPNLVIQKLMEQFGLSLEDAEKKRTKYWAW